MKNINRILLILSSALVPSAMPAQPSCFHRLCDGDEIVKHQLEFLFPGTGGTDAVWDFGSHADAGGSYTVSYRSASDDGNIVIGTEHGTRYQYDQRGDSLRLCGYENRTTKVLYDRPVVLLRHPLSVGDSLSGVFHGTSVYGDRLLLRQYGTFVSRADGCGTLILPDGDTLHGVVRVHTVQLTQESDCPHIRTESGLRHYVDSVHPFSTDSILARMSSGCAVLRTDTWRWYAPGYRHPVLESTHSRRSGGTGGYAVSFVIPPSQQVPLPDATFAPLRRSGQTRPGLPGAATSSGSITLSSGSSFTIAASDGGRSIRLLFQSSMPSPVSITVVTTGGAQVCRRDGQLPAGSSAVTLDLSGQSPGVYLLGVSSSGNTYTEKLTIR